MFRPAKLPIVERWVSIYRSYTAAALLVLLTAGAQETVSAADSKHAATGDEVEVAEQPGRYAFKLGEFRIKNFRPVEREKVTLDFTVYIEVDEGQQERFEQAWRSREHRVRNQIITSARLVPPNQFDDPTLHALRRRIYLRLRRAVPELPVGQVFISDFSYIVE